MPPETPPPSHYVHGTSQAEQARLAQMNRILNDRELPELGLAPGDRVLELGAGTGLCAAALADAIGTEGCLVAIERDPAQLRAAREVLAGRPQVDLRAGDVYEPPLAEGEWGSFDLVHCRFLLEHLPDPGRAVAVAARAARPGGRVVLADDDHELLRTWPEPPGWQALWARYWRAYEGLGNDPLVGRKLVQLLVAAGLQPTRNTYVFFGACSGDPLFGDVVANMVGVVAGAREHLLDEGLDGPRFDRVLEDTLRWRERDDAALWYGVSWAEAQRAPSEPS
ncbi:MAG: methyltransferase domain-containing protein [Planctomycetota bacterium]|nr:methyltransferase domain-containing protein [Planctomycetota bacterium]